MIPDPINLSIGGIGNLTIDNFPGLLDYYNRYPANTAQHQDRADNYLNIMKTALREFDELNGIYNRPSSEYDALAWGGLQYTDAWNNLPFQQKADYEKYNDEQSKVGGCGGQSSTIVE